VENIKNIEINRFSFLSGEPAKANKNYAIATTPGNQITESIHKVYTALALNTCVRKLISQSHKLTSHL